MMRAAQVITKATNSIAAELFFSISNDVTKDTLVYSNSFSSRGCRFSCQRQKA